MHTLICVTFSLPPCFRGLAATCLWLFLDLSVYLFITGNYNYEPRSLIGILEHLKRESLKKRRRDSRRILLDQGLNGKASMPTDDLIHLVRRYRNHHYLAYRSPSLILIFISVAFSSRPLEIGMRFRAVSSPLLRAPMIELLSLLLWWELGTNLPGSGEWRDTSKQFWFWFWQPVTINIHSSRRHCSVESTPVIPLTSQTLSHLGQC